MTCPLCETRINKKKEPVPVRIAQKGNECCVPVLAHTLVGRPRSAVMDSPITWTWTWSPDATPETQETRVRLREKDLDNEEQFITYKRTRRAQQKAQQEQTRPHRDRTQRNRPAHDAKKARREQKRFESALALSISSVPPSPVPPCQKLQWAKPWSCSCMFGKPCTEFVGCTNWYVRFEVARANGWAGFTESERIQNAAAYDVACRRFSKQFGEMALHSFRQTQHRAPHTPAPLACAPVSLPASSGMVESESEGGSVEEGSLGAQSAPALPSWVRECDAADYRRLMALPFT